MTDTEFTARVQRAYRVPHAALDQAAITQAVVAALEHAERRRRLVLAGAALLGTSLTAAGVLALGFTRPLGSIAQQAGELWAAVAREGPALFPSPWAFALVGIVLAASAVMRALEDS